MSAHPDAILHWAQLGLDPTLAQHRRSLIEASAGTGKTWTISVLYLRLLLENGRRVREIAVTTFTDAAAQELRLRIRDRLGWALQEIARRDVDIDDRESDARAWLRARWHTVAPNQDAIALRLALSELDMAPIGTMHALFLKVLVDAPFAADGAFRVGALIGSDELHQELGDDLIRALSQQPGDDAGDREAVDYVLSRTPADRHKLLQALLTPGVTLRAATIDGASLLADASIWAERVRELALRDIYARKGSAVANQLHQLADFLAAGDALAAYKDNGALDEPAGLDKRVRPEFIEDVLADRTYQYAARTSRLLSLRKQMARSRLLLAAAGKLHEWRAQRLRERQQLTFDGLVRHVYAETTRVRDDHGHLADALFAQWPVALIDEFQDTDAQQYAIFDQIYRDHDAVPRGQLILIGDPKQAIYRFRGGDIDAYQRAAATCTQRMRLGVNYRSCTALVAALNDFYDACGDGFAVAQTGIRFEAMRAAGHADAHRLHVHGTLVERPLRLHETGARDEEAVLIACADQIAHYLQPGTARLGEKPLQAGDMAVLLPANHQVARMRALLALRQVPCVGAGRASVFDGETATALRVILHACVHHRDARALRAALSTVWFGLDCDALRALDDNHVQWRRHADTFARLAHMWQERGVLSVVDALLTQAAPRLLASVAGERALTDLRHLGEILQLQANQVHGREELLGWLARQCEGAAADDDTTAKERLLRIESDQARVQLMTLHGAKGLEFPIVMLPLMWAQRGRKEAFPVVTDAHGRRVLDLGSEHIDDALREAAQAAVHERLRVLYVALTRAAQACHVFVGPRTSKDPVQASALDLLLDRCDHAALARSPHIDVAAPLLQQAVTLTPSSSEQRAREERTRVTRVPRHGHQLLSVHSFSTLTHALTQDLADDVAVIIDDEDEEEDNVAVLSRIADRAAHPELLALAELKGAAFGTAVHGVFEHRHKDLPVAAQPGLVRAQMRAAGVRIASEREALRIDTLAQRIDTCLAAEIAPGLRLGALPAAQQRAEMDFQFVLDMVDLPALRTLCAAHGEADLIPTRISWNTLSGFMTGKIDLIFVHAGQAHIVDYKSNYLGDAVDDYRDTSLAAAMQRDHYRFQAFIYTLALDRYLQQRQRDYQRERDLGACFYLFVRAIGLAADAGVWRHRFADALVAQAQVLFARGGGVP